MLAIGTATALQLILRSEPHALHDCPHGTNISPQTPRPACTALNTTCRATSIALLCELGSCEQGTWQHMAPPLGIGPLMRGMISCAYYHRPQCPCPRLELHTASPCVQLWRRVSHTTLTHEPVWWG